MASSLLPSKTLYSTTPNFSQETSSVHVLSNDPNTRVVSDGKKTTISMNSSSSSSIDNSSSPRQSGVVRITPSFAKATNSSALERATLSSDKKEHKEMSPRSEYEHHHHEHSLEKRLLSHGYLVNDYIIDNGKIQYVKARDVNGNIILVKINQDFKSLICKKDSDRKIIHDTKVVSADRKESLMDCVQHLVKGIAFEKDNEYCILSRGKKDHFKVKETMFVRNNMTSLDNFSVAYPIVLLSDIIADDKLTAKNTHEVMNRLYKEHYQSLTKIISSHKDQVYSLYKNIEDIDNKQKTLVKKISDALSFLEDKSSEYDSFSELSSDDKKNYFRLQKNMIAHHDYLVKLLDALSTLKLADDKLEELSKSAKHISELLDNDFQRVGMRHDENS